MKTTLALSGVMALLLVTPSFAQQRATIQEPKSASAIRTPSARAIGGTYGQMMRDNGKDAGIGPATFGGLGTAGARAKVNSHVGRTESAAVTTADSRQSGVSALPPASQSAKEARPTGSGPTSGR